MSEDRVTSLYQRYGPVIFGRCMRLLGDAGAAEDATQETFVRVHRHLAKVPSDDEAIAWIMRIATNYCLNQLRDRSRRDVALAAFGDERRALASYEDIVVDRDLARRIIERTPEKTRLVAWLALVDGLDQSEVARVAGVSRRTVGTRLKTFVEQAKKYAARAAS